MSKKIAQKVFRVTLTSVLIVSWLFSPFAPLFNGSTWPSNSEKAEAASGDVILLWDTADGAIPSGWTCISCAGGDAFFGVFPRAADAYGGATAGADTMNHTATYSSQTAGASVGMNSSTAGTAFPLSTHTHSFGNPTLTTVDIKPPYQNLKLIKKSNPTTLPINVIGMFDTGSLPSGWTRYTSLDNDYLRGDNDNASGGASTHTHTTTAGVTSGATSGSRTDPGNGLTTAGPTHTHAIATAQSVTADNNAPPYITVVFAKLGSDGASLPDGLVAFFDATPPTNWASISGAATSYYQRFIVGSATAGTTGGSATHSHGDSATWTTGAPSATGNNASGALTQTNTNTHTHTVTYTISSGSSLPVYRDVILGKYSQPTGITVGSAVDQPTSAFKGATDVTLGTASISRNTSSASVTAVTVKENGGTINASTNMSNIELWLSYDNAWSADDNQLSTAGSFSGADGSITFTETFTATSGIQYLIVRGDIGSGASAGQTIEIQIESLTSSDTINGTPLNITGTTAVANPPTISSAGVQSFTAGDPSTPISAITITDDATTPTIASTTDIRITIPNELDMTWDTSDTTIATSSASLDSYVEQLFTTDVPVITIDLSGITYNPLTNSVFMVVNGTPQINEFSVDGTWRRTITMSGFIDTEGITWMYGTKFAVTEERSPYDIIIVDIGPSTTSITKTGGTVIDPAITFVSNLGFEGISYDPVNDWFYVVSEANAAGTAGGGGRVFKILMDGSFTEYTTLNSALFSAGATDLADIAYDRASGHLFVLSQEAETVYEVDLSGNIYDTMAISKYFQPEGFALSWDNSQMFIVGETNEYSYFNRGAASTSVSYENSGKTLVLNVYQDFHAGDSLTISGLAFNNFGSASGPDYLDLIVSGSGGAVASSDDKSKSVIVSTPITVSGRLYSDEGSTLVTSGKTIKVAIGTSSPGVFTTTSNGSGVWSISPNSFAADTAVTAWVDGDTNFRASTVTVASSSVNNITNIDLYQNRVIIKHEATSGTVTNTLLSSYDGDNDNDIQFSENGGAFTMAKGQELYIWPGKTYAPGGAVTLHGNAGSAPDGALDIRAGSTFTAGGTVTLAGSWNAESGAVFNSNSQAVVFNATTSGKTITVPSSGHNFYSLTFDGSGGAWAFSSAATTSDLTITNGTLTAPSSRLSLLGNYSNAGTFTHNSGTLIFASSTTQTIGGTLIGSSALGNVIARDSGIKSFNSSASTTNLTVESGSTVLGPSSRLTIAGNYSNSGTFTHNAGTTTFNGTSGQSIAGTLNGTSAFRNLEFLGSGTKTFSGNASTTNLFIFSGSGTVTAGSIFSIGGTYSNAATFDSNLGIIYFSGTGSQTAMGTMTGSSKFADVLLRGSGGAGAAGTWYNQSFAYRKKITLAGSKLGTTTSSFPVLIDLTDSDLSTNAQADFDDVIFVNSDNTTQLDHEIEYLDASTGRITAWVETAIASSTDTDIYMYYGNSGAANSENAAGVWDSNYVLVMHFAETAGNYLDSTSPANDATEIVVTSRTTPLSGAIGYAPQFGGTNATYITIPDSADFDMYGWTIEAYINPTAAGTTVSTGSAPGLAGYPIVDKGIGEGETTAADVQFFVGQSATGVIATDFEDNRLAGGASLNNGLTGSTAMTSNGTAWSYIAASINPDTDAFRVFLNGRLDGSLTNTYAPSQGGTQRVGIGTGTKTDTTENGGFAGYIDEVRISKIERHRYDIWTTGNNLTSTSTFYSIGSQESPGRTVTFANDATVRALTIDTGLTFNAPSAGTLTIEGNYNNQGTFTHNNGTTTFGGSSLQTISGVATGTSAFYNVEITNSSGSDAESSPGVKFLVAASTTNNFYAVTPNSKIVFPAGATATTTIGNLILNGQAVGTRVTLRSTSPGSFWGLAVSGTRSISYANVKDSNACSGYSTIDASNGTNLDAGNNTCWNLGVQGSPTLLSADQVFEIGQSPTGAATFTVIDVSSPVVTAAGDLRIAIATSSVNMLWQTGVSTLTVGGTASGKVSNTVTYEGGGSVAVIPVNTNFSSNDTLTIAGLQLTSFNTVVPATNAFTMFLSGATDIIADATDTATVAIKGKYVLQDHTLGQITNAFSGLESSLSATPVFRFAIVPTGENISISNLVFDLSSVSGFSSSDLTSVGLYIDYNGNGTIDATDLQVGGAGSVSISGNTGTITFSSSFSATTTRNYILKEDVANISAGDRITFKLLTGSITSSGATSVKTVIPTGSITQIAHSRVRPGGSGAAGSHDEIGGAGAPGAGTVGGGNTGGGTDVGGQGGNGNGTVGGGSSGGGGEI
jgi:uncharacterized protein YjiK